jgi:hypothetical protein
MKLKGSLQSPIKECIHMPVQSGSGNSRVVRSCEQSNESSIYIGGKGEITCETERLLVSQERLCSMDVVRFNTG